MNNFFLGKNIRLSVCMVTYNHELYIKKSIESVYAQVTDFEIELVIGEDASGDKTASIINSLLSSSKTLTKVQFNEQNIGAQKNFTSTLQRCTGQYIALLEGDDYWIDSKKLQAQVDFLDRNPDFSMCYHPVKIDSGKGILTNEEINVERDISDIYDLAKGNFMHTCSVVFRSKLFESFPSTYENSPVGDYFLHMLNAQHGKIKRLPDTMGVYRVHSGGVWSMQPNMDLKILTYLEAMVDCFEPDVAAILKNRHQTLAVRSLFQRINEPNFDERLERCLKFGSVELQRVLLEKNQQCSQGSFIYNTINRIKRFF